MKRCCTCKQEKEEKNFGKLTKAKDGLNPICKTCKNSKALAKYYSVLKPNHLTVGTENRICVLCYKESNKSQFIDRHCNECVQRKKDILARKIEYSERVSLAKCEKSLKKALDQEKRAKLRIEFAKKRMNRADDLLVVLQKTKLDRKLELQRRGIDPTQYYA